MIIFKKILAYLIGYFPVIRCFLYRSLLGYKIVNSRIGFGTVICVESFCAINSYLGRNNIIQGPCRVDLGCGVVIADRNRFICGEWSNSSSRGLKIKSKANITSDHYFDLSGGLVIGERSWVAGRGCQVWTHGAWEKPKEVTIGDDSYIATSSILLPGSSLGNRCVLGAGSVLTKSFREDGFIYAGSPAKVIKEKHEKNS